MSTLQRNMTSPAMKTPATTSPSLTKSMNKIPFKLLEIKVISAHDLPPVSKCLHTYVMVWVHPDHKLITPVDHKGNTNPTWNYRMVFGVDDKFLRLESSAVMMEIYNISRLSNKPIGTTYLPVESLLNNPHSEIMKKPLTLQIIRPSGDIKGSLIVTVNLVNTTIRNRNEVDEMSPRMIMIRQINHGLTHSESSEEITFDEDEEHDDINTLSDPECGSVDSQMKPLPIDVAGGLCSSNGGNAGEHNSNEEANVVKLGDDKILIKGKEPKVKSLHRRHSDGGGLFSCFTSSLECAFICGSSSMSNKNMNKKLKKKTRGSRKSRGQGENLPSHEI